MKKTFALLIALISVLTISAQRYTDRLDRGLVAQKMTTGVFVSWRIPAEEYYDVTYNLYKDGGLLKSGLNVSCYQDNSGAAASRYQVSAVVRGKEQELSETVSPWSKTDGNSNTYWPIPMKPVYSRKTGQDITTKCNYIINDVCLGDLTGNGKIDFLVKRLGDDNTVGNDSAYNYIEAYTMEGERLWYIDCGPNTLSNGAVELNAVSFDWDMDGRCEVVARFGDGAIIHDANGVEHVIGSLDVNTRYNGMEYTYTGDEWLVYLDGKTGVPYHIGPTEHPEYMTYPLLRGSDSDWGTGIVGHRSSKYFFGAPFLDGHHPSIFLARGAYSQHKMAAYDVDPLTHQLTQIWEWHNNVSTSPWYGNGFHNYCVADVDWDGRDEIVYGSMVIDDNGLGLSTTGLGHGDAQHCSDFDPYRHGQEIFTCNEAKPCNNYRDATTSTIYYRLVGNDDDGRAMCANVSDAYPGAEAASAASGIINCCSAKVIDGWTNNWYTGNDPMALNFRIYWDGDLLEETVNSPGTEKECIIVKPSQGRIFQTGGVSMCNWTKNTPCAMGDIIGDWREELVLRDGSNKELRIYTTPKTTTYRNYSLWHDHQYRNGMVWEECGYNQPPHTSYFLGNLEDITMAPPALTMTGREEVADGGTITDEDKHFIVCDNGNTEIHIADGAKPYMVTFNVPSHVEGTAASNCTVQKTSINTTYSTCNVTGGALAGSMRFVKQGDGTLNLPKVDMAYTGTTDVWAGVLNFDGTLKNSELWLNRFAELNSNGGEFCSIKADYGSIIRPGGENKKGEIVVDSLLTLNFGSHIVLDLYSENTTSDFISTKTLKIGTKTGEVWQKYGPEYLMPVIEVTEHINTNDSTLAEGCYLIAKADSVIGNLNDIKIEGVTTLKASLKQDENGFIYLSLSSVRDASYITWTGNEGSTWDYGTAKNFYLTDDADKTPDIFVNGDVVEFNDDAATYSVSIASGQELSVDNLIVNSQKNYTFAGGGSVVNGALVKEGDGTVTISNDNTYIGGNYLRGGTVKVSSLANKYQAYGNLGGMTTSASKFTMENGATLQNTSDVEQGSPMQMKDDEGGIINTTKTFTMDSEFSGTLLTKKGSGNLVLQGSSVVTKMSIQGGTVTINNGSPSKSVELKNGTLVDNVFNSTHPSINVTADCTATWKLSPSYYQAYENSLTGSGTITIIPTNTVCRSRVTGNWSAFTGTIKHTTAAIWFPLDASTGLPNGTLNLAADCGMTNTCKSFTIGKLTGSGKLCQPISNFTSSAAVSGNNTWNVGNSSDELGDFTWSGIVYDENGTCKTNFCKVGTCKMTVSGAWQNHGTTRVNAGELHINSGATIGYGTLTVAEGATLSGVSKSVVPMTNSLFTINGTLDVGITSTVSSGYMNFNGKDVTFGENSNLNIRLRTCATATTIGNTYITNIGTLKMNGTINIALNSAYEPTMDAEVADSFFVWTSVTTMSGTPKLSLPELPVYNYWDTSRINEGILLVRFDKDKYEIYANGINSLSSQETVTVTVVAANGVAMGKYNCTANTIMVNLHDLQLCKGIYLLNIVSESGKKFTLKYTK